MHFDLGVTKFIIFNGVGDIFAFTILIDPFDVVFNCCLHLEMLDMGH